MNTKTIESSFQLVGTAIRKFEVNNQFTHLYEDESIEKSFDVSYELGDIEIISDELIMGAICLSVIVDVINKASDQDQKLSICLDFEGCFSSEIDDISHAKEQFVKLLSFNGCATLYSISRSIICSMAGQVCFGCHITLPMINVFELNENIDNE